MARYEILFRPLAEVKAVRGMRGEFLEHDVIVNTTHREIVTDVARRRFRAEDSDTHMRMDFANDDDAIDWALAFNGLHLDPWRVDWIFGPDGADVFTR